MGIAEENMELGQCMVNIYRLREAGEDSTYWDERFTMLHRQYLAKYHSEKPTDEFVEAQVEYFRAKEQAL